MIYGNKSVKAKVVDACPSCEKNDLGECLGGGKWAFPLTGFCLADLSPAAFEDLASLFLGSIEIKWKFIA